MGGYWYTTKQGDMWDYIAWVVYGDEYKMDVLLGAEENYGILDQYIFSAGVKVWCPEIEADTDAEDDDTEDAGDIPSWRDEAESDDSNDYDSGDDEDEEEEDEI